MKSVIFITIICFFIQGCSATINILNVTVDNIDALNVNLAIETDEKISEYDNSSYAYEVMLRYYIDTDDIKKQAHSIVYPFSCRRIKKRENENYISKWKIPLRDKINFLGQTYQYDFSKQNKNTIIIKLYGATMGWGKVQSSPYKLQF